MIAAPFSRTLPSLLDEQAFLGGQRIAVIANDHEYSYADLARRSRQLASALRARGVRRGERIGILLSNRIEWLEICFGASAAGATIVPISTWSKEQELEFILQDAGIRTLFTLPQLGKEDFAGLLRNLVPEAHQNRSVGEWRSERLPLLRNLVLVSAQGGTPGMGWSRYEDLFMDAAAITETLAPGDGPSATDDAFILYTSGSTNKPKAVPLAHFGLIENGFNIGERQGLEPQDRVLAAIPLFWAYGAANALPATFSHASTLVLQERFEAAGALALIERHRCTSIYTLPGMTTALIRHPTFNPKRTRSLRTGLTIGNPQDVVNAATVLGASRICNIYGSSETYGNCCVTPSSWPLDRRSSCQGPPLPGVSIRLTDVKTGAPAKSGSSGLIEVHGYLMGGYLGHSAVQNAEVFTADGWYRSGDMGQFSAEGDIIFMGRNSEMIKRSGINISPADVEDILMQHRSVAEAGVVGAPDLEKGEEIVAFVVAVAGASITAEELFAHCRSVASQYKVPDRIEFRDGLPASATGKLLRQPLKQEALNLRKRPLQGISNDA